MKYLRYFAKDSDYHSVVMEGGEGLDLPNVSYTVDQDKVYYNPLTEPTISLLNGELGDIVLYDNVSNKKIAVSQSSLNTTDYPSEQYLPVGIVVIPASHDVYGTGECGIMSLVNMASGTPETGTVKNVGLYWGGHDIELSLPNLTQVPLISTALTSNEITGVNSYGYLPTTRFTSNKPSVGNGLDTTAGYYLSYTDATAPSPYLEDGSRNPSYYCNDGRLVASGSSQVALSENCLSDFDGIGNTQVILDAATGQTDWKTASAITNSDSSGYYPAACCTWRFHTSGTSQGDWYLPAEGEMGYMIARFNEIQNGLQRVSNIYGSSLVCLLDTDNYYWSSSEYSGSRAHLVFTDNGTVSNDYLNTNNYVRAFLRA